MAKWYGVIGYVKLTETGPGIWEEIATERNYYGEVTRTARSLQTASTLNDNVTISNSISILSDPFAIENFASMRYIEFMGAKWTVSNVEVQYPRLIITTGGLYHAV